MPDNNFKPQTVLKKNKKLYKKTIFGSQMLPWLKHINSTKWFFLQGQHVLSFPTVPALYYVHNLQGCEHLHTNILSDM